MAIWIWFAALALLGVALFAVGGRISRSVVGAILAALGVAVFAIRLHHEGPYPVPRGLDLGFGVASLVAGAALLRPTGARSTLARLLVAASPVLVFGALIAVLHEAEEVVVLRTSDAQGTIQEARLWIVDYDGAPWIVTGPTTEHVRRLTADPHVTVVRKGVPQCFLAKRFDDRETIEAAFHAREQKYWMQRFGEKLGLWSAPSGDIRKIAVAIRLDPCPP
jgi:hypothetical protein